MFEKEAEEYVCGLFPSVNVFASGRLIQAFKDGAKFGYNKGLEEGRSKWHKVADGDLPKEEAEYPVIFESDGTRYKGLECYYPDTKEWSTICDIIVWCELPKFEEE